MDKPSRRKRGPKGPSIVKHLYPDFLTNPDQYAASESFWETMWLDIDPEGRTAGGWFHPWLSTGSPMIQDGNPIFSACSPSSRRGLRIIQHEPTKKGPELVAYQDLFSDELDSDEGITELVISCALSDLVAEKVQRLLESWVLGKSLLPPRLDWATRDHQG